MKVNLKSWPNSIFIEVREWRDKVNGNTYYSALVSIDGEWQFTTGMKYGYGDNSINEAAKEMRRLGFIPTLDPYQAFTRQARENDCHLYTAKRDVLKRELPAKAYREGLSS